MKMNSIEDVPNETGTGSDKSMPKDAQVIVSIIKDLGFQDYEPRVVNILLEVAYRYLTTILEDAKLISGHAKKKAVDGDDIRLAVQMYVEENMTTPPSREIVLDAARHRNNIPLPVPKPTSGLRLPPDRFCVTACNYQLSSEAPSNPLPVNRIGSSLFAPQNGCAPTDSLNHVIKQERESSVTDFQIQSGTSEMGTGPLFNANSHSSSLKRKADDMDMDNGCH